MSKKDLAMQLKAGYTDYMGAAAFVSMILVSNADLILPDEELSELVGSITSHIKAAAMDLLKLRGALGDERAVADLAQAMKVRAMVEKVATSIAADLVRRN